MIRVLILSQRILPSSLRKLLEISDELTGVQKLPAEMILFDCDVWNRSAFTQLKLHTDHFLPVIVLCEKYEEPFGTESILRGEISALLKRDATADQLMACFRAVLAGLKTLQHFSPATRHIPGILTPREIEILRLIADGEGNKSIAYLLEISPHTVKFHISSIFEKLQVSSRTEAIRAGMKLPAHGTIQRRAS